MNEKVVKERILSELNSCWMTLPKLHSLVNRNSPNAEDLEHIDIDTIALCTGILRGEGMLSSEPVACTLQTNEMGYFYIVRKL